MYILYILYNVSISNLKMYCSDINKLSLKFLLKVKLPRKINYVEMKKRGKGNEEEADEIRTRMSEFRD